MKKSLRHLLFGSAAALAASGSAQAAPFITIADTVDVFFLGTAGVDYRTNLFNASQKRDDVVFTLSPGLEARLGRTENARISLVFKEDFLIYNKYTGQNTHLANVILTGVYKSGPVNLDGGFSYVQSQTNTPDTFVLGINDLFVKRDIYRAFANIKYDYSPKFWLQAGASWNRFDYTNNDQFGNAFANSDLYSLPIDFFYRYSPKFSVGLGYRYRHTRVQSRPGVAAHNYNDHFFSLALDGEITSKLQASANIGYQLRDASSSNGGNHGQFGLNFDLTYDVHEKLELFAGARHDFNTTSSGSSSEVLSGNFGANYLITSFISASGQVRYDHTKYVNSSVGRKDDTTYVSLSLNYAPNSYLTFSTGYGYTNNSSTYNPASFMGHSINFTASVRY